MARRGELMRRLRVTAAHLAAGELQLLRERDPPLQSPSEPHPVHATELFDRAQFGEGITPAQKAQMDHDGHLLLPGLMTPAATARLIEAIRRVGEFGGRWKAGNRPKAILARLREMAEALDPASPSYAADVAALQREKAEMYAQYPHAGDHSPGACPYEWVSPATVCPSHLARGLLTLPANRTSSWKASSGTRRCFVSREISSATRFGSTTRCC